MSQPRRTDSVAPVADATRLVTPTNIERSLAYAAYHAALAPHERCQPIDDAHDEDAEQP